MDAGHGRMEMVGILWKALQRAGASLGAHILLDELLNDFKDLEFSCRHPAFGTHLSGIRDILLEQRRNNERENGVCAANVQKKQQHTPARSRHIGQSQRTVYCCMHARPPNRTPWRQSPGRRGVARRGVFAYLEICLYLLPRWPDETGDGVESFLLAFSSPAGRHTQLFATLLATGNLSALSLRPRDEHGVAVRDHIHFIFYFSLAPRAPGSLSPSCRYVF